MSKNVIYCPFCGTQNLIEAKYCSNCGENIADHVINASIPTLNNLEKNSASTSPITTAIQSKSPSIMTVYAQKPYGSSIGINECQRSKPIKYANFADRIVAFILDVAIFAGILMLIELSFGVQWLDIFEFDVNIIPWGSFLLTMLLFILYLWIFEAFKNGQSPGKMLCYIRTVDANTKNQISPGQAFIHVLCKEILIIPDIIFGFFTNKDTLEHKNQTRFTQKLANTVVIKWDNEDAWFSNYHCIC